MSGYLNLDWGFDTEYSLWSWRGRLGKCRGGCNCGGIRVGGGCSDVGNIKTDCIVRTIPNTIVVRAGFYFNKKICRRIGIEWDDHIPAHPEIKRVNGKDTGVIIVGKLVFFKGDLKHFSRKIE